jgi:hypothetical protein
MVNFDKIQNSQNARINQKDAQVKNTENMAAFVAAYKQAEKTLQVPDAEKKQKDKWQKKRGRNLNKEDYTEKDEIDEMLEEIDKRINQLLETAKGEGQ